MSTLAAAALLLCMTDSAQPVPPPTPIGPLPSAAQLRWHELEYYAFVHFNMNTFTGREWGTGDEDPARFDPSDFDARHWARIFRAAGMRGVIITAKHHDGFCLWPTATTDHSVARSPWRGGKGDLLRELSDACRAEGLLFGVYLSPWDRNSPVYGDSPAYNEFFRRQLREVTTNYGPLFEVWFDGACGEGPNGRRQEYDWPSFVAVVRETQPDAVIFSDAGPDVRWVGNERGYGSETNWALLRRDEFFPGIPNREAELGTGHRDGTHWVPAEVDVSIRPGWYWRRSENDRVKTLRELEEIWYASVGRGCNLLLNVPADRRGLIPEPDQARLLELRTLLDATFATDLAAGATATASNVRGNAERFAAARVLDGDAETYWATDDGVVAADLVLELGAQRVFDRIEIREAIALGQRVDRFAVDARVDGAWREVAQGTTIGPNRILRFAPTKGDAVRVRILEGKGPPTIRSVRLFQGLPEVAIETDAVGGGFLERATVALRCDVPGALVRYTLDGSDPTSSQSARRYEGPFVLAESASLRAVAEFEGLRGVHPASLHLTRIDPAALRPDIQLLVEPRPGLRVRRFDCAISRLDELPPFEAQAPAWEGVATELALPRERPADRFAFVFDGYLQVPTDGIYTFSLFADDGARLFLGGERIVDRDGGAVWEHHEGRVPLKAGWHPFRVEYFEMAGEERFRVRWSGPGFRDEAIPASALFH